MLAEYVINLFNLQDHGFNWVLLAVLLVFFGGTYWVLNKSVAANWFKASEEVVPTYLALPAIMFALFISALATDIWQKHYDARQALINEASAVRSIILLAPSLGEDGRGLIQSAEKYINGVIDREWQSMSTKDHANRENAQPELEALDSTITKIGSDSRLMQYQALRLSHALETLRVSRQQRLSLAHDAISASKWASSMALAIITLMTIGVVHIRRPRAMLISMTITVVCVLATTVVLYQNRSPYIGTAAVNSSMLYDAKKLVDHVKN
jgi:hypothetical protein